MFSSVDDDLEHMVNARFGTLGFFYKNGMVVQALRLHYVQQPVCIAAALSCKLILIYHFCRYEIYGAMISTNVAQRVLCIVRYRLICTLISGPRRILYRSYTVMQ